MPGAPICCDCGGPRSPASGQRCRRCYVLRADARRLLKHVRFFLAEVNAANDLGRHIGDLDAATMRALPAPLQRLSDLLAPA